MSNLDFTIDQDGKDHVVDDDHIVSELKRLGHDVSGMSADGRTLTINQPDAKGAPQPVQVPTENALKALGHSVTKVLPSNSEKGTVDPVWSAELQSLPDPNMKKAYIEAKLKHKGIDNPQVIGHENEYHVFDPTNNKWHQITEEPGLNKAGLLSAGLALPHLIGSAVGGTLGAGAGTALGGPAAPVTGPLGMMTGAAAGGAAGEGLRQAGLSYFDPDYGDVAGKHLTEEAWNAAKTGGLDAAGHGIAKGVMASPLGKLIPEAPFSKMAQIAGRGTAAVGRGLHKMAGAIADSDFLSQAAADLTPGVGAVTGPGQFMQLPQAAVTGAAKLAAGAPESGWLKALMGEENAGKLGAWGSDVLSHNRPPTGFAQTTEDLAAKGARAMGGKAKTGEYSARNILGNAQARSKAGEIYKMSPAGQAAEEGIYKDALEDASHVGNPETFARQSVAGHRANLIRSLMRELPAKGGETTGRALDELAHAGNYANQLGVGATRLGLRAAQGVGAAAQGVGGATSLGGTLAEPLEMPLAARYGIPKAANWWEDRQRRP